MELNECKELGRQKTLRAVSTLFLTRLYARRDAYVVMKDMGNILRNAQRSSGDSQREAVNRVSGERTSSNRKGFGRSATGSEGITKSRWRPRSTTSGSSLNRVADDRDYSTEVKERDLVHVEEDDPLTETQVEHPDDFPGDEQSEEDSEQEEEPGKVDSELRRRRESDDLEPCMSAFPSKGPSVDSRSPDKKSVSGCYRHFSGDCVWPSTNT